MSAQEKRREASRSTAHSNVHYPFRPDHDPFWHSSGSSHGRSACWMFLTQFHFQIETQLSVLNASPTGGVLRRMKHASKMNYHLDNSMRAHVSGRFSSTPAEFDAAPGIPPDIRIAGSLYYQNHILFSGSYDGNTVWSAVSEQILLFQRAGCVPVCFCLAAEFTRSPC